MSIRLSSLASAARSQPVDVFTDRRRVLDAATAVCDAGATLRVDSWRRLAKTLDGIIVDWQPSGAVARHALRVLKEIQSADPTLHNAAREVSLYYFPRVRSETAVLSEHEQAARAAIEPAIIHGISDSDAAAIDASAEREAEAISAHADALPSRVAHRMSSNDRSINFTVSGRAKYAAIRRGVLLNVVTPTERDALLWMPADDVISHCEAVESATRNQRSMRSRRPTTRAGRAERSMQRATKIAQRHVGAIRDILTRRMPALAVA